MVTGTPAAALQVADDVAQLGTCPRAKVGAVLARPSGDGIVGYEVVATGWNTTHDGADCTHDPARPCDETIHAEATALAAACREGIATRGLVAFLTLSPCAPCARLLHAAGIARVLYRDTYRDPAGLGVLRAAGVPTYGLH